MCTPKTPKAPDPEKPKPLRILLSRDRFGKTGGGGGGRTPSYLLPPQTGRRDGGSFPGGPTSPGLNVL